MKNDDLIINLEDDDEIDIDLKDSVNPSIPYEHSNLLNLDYETSGHKGFMPSDSKNIREAKETATNGEIELFGNDGEKPARISIDKLLERLIANGNVIPQNLQEGQYFLLNSNNKYKLYIYNNQELKELNLSVSANDVVETQNAKVMTHSEREKLAGIEAQAQVNIFEGLIVNGTDLPIINKKSNLDLTPYALGDESASTFTMTLNPQTFELTINLYDRDNNLLETQTIDLPEETMVVDGRYDNTTKSLILVLRSGSEITIPVGDLISGLQSEITAQNKLNADLVDDTSSTHKFTNQNDINKLSGIEANAQVNVMEGIQVNGVDLSIDVNKKANINLTPYVLKTDIASVSANDIKSLFNQNGGGE